MDDRQRVASSFDDRAPSYSQNQWHRVYAEGLIELARLRDGDYVLDAGVGTGFAAIAAARKVGVSGYVLGVDLSPGMLQQARAAVDAARLGNVELRLADNHRECMRVSCPVKRCRWTAPRRSDPNPSYREQSAPFQQVKHEVIRCYLNGWYSKLGTWSAILKWRPRVPVCLSVRLP